MAIRPVVKGEVNPNTSKKKLKNIEKMGGWDPNYVQAGNPLKEHPVHKAVKEQNSKEGHGNRPADKTRRTRIKKKKPLRHLFHRTSA